jgi:transposase InsO family protein
LAQCPNAQRLAEVFLWQAHDPGSLGRLETSLQFGPGSDALPSAVEARHDQRLRIPERHHLRGHHLNAKARHDLRTLPLVFDRVGHIRAHVPDQAERERWRRTALAEGIATLKTKPVLHADNGATLKATTVLAMLNWLGVKPSYSRPRVSDDNAFSASLFRTAKYRPEFPAKGFADLDPGRAWAAGFVHWYNVDHHHSVSVLPSHLA